MIRYCTLCGERMELPDQRGRPRTKCDACRPSSPPLRERPAPRPFVDRRGPGRGQGQRKGVWDPERAERMLRAYVDDNLTLEQIGQRHGVTRERVRQLIDKYDRPVVRLHLQRRKARTRLRRFVQDTPCLDPRHCRLCGELFTTTPNSTQAFCDRFHNTVWSTYFRFHVDQDFHARQKLAVTRWQVRNGGEHKFENHLRNLEDGTAKTVGRWLVFGSTTWHWAVRAYYLQWPVWFELPEQIQQQIIDHEGPLRSEVTA